MPQLPTITVVTPWDSLASICGVRITLVSSCVWTSMKPGERTRPSPSDHLPGPVLGELADRADKAAIDGYIGCLRFAAAAVDEREHCG